ncbi:MAG: polysaccharide biosynthesis protein [Alphaproteobacteria bacterium]|nr:polysaccharide biosynthesis protein [Alphaproteobacteria bacterium]
MTEPHAPKPRPNAVFSGQTILVTGGTGSFGGAFAKYLLQTDVGEIRIVSRDEAKQEMMRVAFADPRLRFFLGDVRDERSIDIAMKGVNYVFHAAALKQVPACELFPDQAVMTNVMGSRNVIDSAIRHGIRRLVSISTDKAVYPVNAMGMSKALMEKQVQARARTLTDDDTVLAVVRYGNVIASRGSVVPVFLEQMKTGQPLTITAPEMTRFLLTLDDAIALIEFALLHAKQGDIFVRKSPASTVADLATAMVAMFGYAGGQRTIGVRPGEKLHETLCTANELASAEEFPDYFRVAMDARTIDSDPLIRGKRPSLNGTDYSSDTARQLPVGDIQAVLESLSVVQDALTASRARSLSAS